MATPTKDRKSRIDLDAKVRDQMTALLNQHLADSFDLYSQMKQAHWNVKGPNFFQLHELFDTLAEEILTYVDMIAERCTALGANAKGTARMAAANSSLSEFPENLPSDMDFVEAVTERVSTFAASCREAIDTADEAGDMATSDLFTEITRGVDKQLYFLESHLQ